MRDWHVKHMQDTVVRYLAGLPEDASRWQKRLNKRYGNLAQVTKRIDYDIKHGVEKQEVLALELVKQMSHTASSGKQLTSAINWTLWKQAF